MLGAEDLLRPVYGELLGLIYPLTAAVVPLTRIALGVLVGQNRALRRQHRGGGEVFAGYQLDGRPLAFELPVERLLNLGVHDFGVRTQHLPTSALLGCIRCCYRGITCGCSILWGSGDPRFLPDGSATLGSINVVRNALKPPFSKHRSSPLQPNLQEGESVQPERPCKTAGRSDSSQDVSPNSQDVTEARAHSRVFPDRSGASSSDEGVGGSC